MKEARKHDWRDPATWDRKLRKEPNGCWVWTGFCDRYGYGKQMVGANGHNWMWLAHRLAYQMLVGPLPDSAQVLHRCDNPPCCNPEHLFLGDPKANALDRTYKGRTPSGEKHYNAKLTDAAVRDIRRRLAKGELAKVLATEYGVGIKSIYAVRDGRTWRHVA